MSAIILLILIIVPYFFSFPVISTLQVVKDITAPCLATSQKQPTIRDVQKSILEVVGPVVTHRAFDKSYHRLGGDTSLIRSGHCRSYPDWIRRGSTDQSTTCNATNRCLYQTPANTLHVPARTLYTYVD